jgi:hypothetical protein
VPFLGTRGAGTTRGFGFSLSTIPGRVLDLLSSDIGSGRAFNNGRIDLSWTAPSSNGATITGYKIERSLDGSTYSTLVENTGTTSTSYSNTGLNSGQIYYYRVSAINAVGAATASNVGSVTATTVPQAPSVTVANVGTGRAFNNGAATITVTGGATGGQTISSYTATSSPGSFTSTAGSPLTVTGLQSATGYTFSVTATNNNGTSTATTSSSITATTIPQAPTISSVGGAGTADQGRLRVAFTAGATGGASITYSATISGVGTVTGASSPLEFTGLTANQNYTVSLSAVNSNGSSSAASSSGLSSRFTCPSGGTLSGSSCITSGQYNATASTVYLSCTIYHVNGFVCNGDRCCRLAVVRGTGKVYEIDLGQRPTSTTYSCPSGGTLSGTVCLTSSSYAASIV